MEQESELLSLNTLARILTLYFSSEKGTKITPSALELITQYLRIYSKEAVCRAYEEKKNSIMSSSENEDIVLELEDLENGIAAQLALDFS
ncbi:CENP-X ortholog, FANCM-MHF complex subunit Mhf2 [Schizosaccharomyces pombe]|uniref:Inner kinetochore subunit mhf2 n=1 Tax=Schizosaccharomyces pombe (strain 972 / ATCC 24843) TaxID=284812 RepID=CENPX_SCHPO|nr:FANCM-MHF complex subunit Mhf2 [Schizosaccharomyces pombe]O74896.1 RecName: Full=Inner kinetochore subunit mhf2; AltName: Full=CENP-X homolog; AltName: Full=Constitutive centromere-associated network protein mhf2; AltName: Full=MHF histone-fold complex subunit 2 [Schizosaccharomyces pombe 972h-]CAA21191.1 FANCM-MHF complex subunit Mhf2 [Schizosaccharomyces pombe]|eukprot:NP_588439.1 FANCM-MHF complex subunit Mhf2 [Schizosaccharomyces pombe]